MKTVLLHWHLQLVFFPGIGHCLVLTLFKIVAQVESWEYILLGWKSVQRFENLDIAEHFHIIRSSNYSTAGLIKLKLSYIYQIHYALESLIPLSLIWAKPKRHICLLGHFSHKMLFLLNMVRNGISGYFIIGNLFHLILALIGQEGDLRGAYVNNGVLILSRKHFLCLILLACQSAVSYVLRTSEFLRTQ